MTSVVAHTDAIGSSFQPLIVTWTYKYGKNGYKSNLRNSSTSAISYKSPTVKGLIDPLTKFKFATPYSRCVARCESLASGEFETTGGYFYEFPDSRYSGTVSFSGYYGFNTSNGEVFVSANTSNRAKTEALNKVLNQKINIATTLAEAKKTVSWLSTRLKDLAYAIKLLRKRQYIQLYHYLRKFKYTGSEKIPTWKTLRQHNFAPTQSPSTVWLEFWYAFMPLVYDISGAMNQLRDGFREKQLLFHVERTVTNALNPTNFINSYWKDGPIFSGKAEESSKVTLWGTVPNTPLNAINQLGFINPAVVAWELVGYSFVIDWLIPIGDWLQSLTATVGVTFVDGHEVKRVVANVEVEVSNPFRASSGTMKRGSKPRGRVRIFAMQRIVFPTWPGSLPYVKNPFSNKNTITAIALIGNLRR